MAGVKQRRWWFVVLGASLALMGCRSNRQFARSAPHQDIVATYSIVAFDPATGDLGVAVQSKFFGVGSVVPWAKAGVGAIATQAYANVNYGPKALELMQAKKRPEDIVLQLTADDDNRGVRQFGLVDAEGRAAAYTGSKCQTWAGHIVGTNFTVEGNILFDEAVVKAMAEAYESARKNPDTELADWLVAALNAGESKGGDRRGRQSAALLVVREGGGYSGMNDRYVDLRVEDNPEPLQELGRLLEMHKKFYAQQHANPPRRPVKEGAK